MRQLDSVMALDPPPLATLVSQLSSLNSPKLALTPFPPFAYHADRHRKAHGTPSCARLVCCPSLREGASHVRSIPPVRGNIHLVAGRHERINGAGSSEIDCRARVHRSVSQSG